ncbi:MAG: hypothetical protein ABL311_04495 [Nitratireductor rhodophyticola]|uniref:hypothetical protein n=1 Tax=Nitratireductor rhodophyticola TaxID=2854036 RepID=UPI0032D976C0
MFARRPAHSSFLSFLFQLSPSALSPEFPAQSLCSTVTNIASEKFQMTEKQRRDREISRREAEMFRVEAIQDEMASAVRLLGGEGSAKEQINKAARAARLPITVIERLRWKKIKRVPADLADAIREAVARQNEESLGRAKHELFIAQQKNALLAAQLREIDPDLYGPEIDRLGRSLPGVGRSSDLQGGV